MKNLFKLVLLVLGLWILILIFFSDISNSRFDKNNPESFKNFIPIEIEKKLIDKGFIDKRDERFKNKEKIFIINLRNPPIRKIKNPSQSESLIFPVKWLESDKPGQIIYIDKKRFLIGRKPELGQIFVINGKPFELVGVIPIDRNFIDQLWLEDLLDEKMLYLN